MNQQYVTFDDEGMIVSAGFGTPPEGAVIVDGTLSASDLLGLYVDGGNGLVPRPKVTAPNIVDDILTIPAGPNGTLLRLFDQISGEIMWQTTTDDTEIEHVLTLPDHGTYAVEVEPPFPWVSMQVEFVK